MRWPTLKPINLQTMLWGLNYFPNCAMNRTINSFMLIHLGLFTLSSYSSLNENDTNTDTKWSKHRSNFMKTSNCLNRLKLAFVQLKPYVAIQIIEDVDSKKKTAWSILEVIKSSINDTETCPIITKQTHVRLPKQDTVTKHKLLVHGHEPRVQRKLQAAEPNA